MRTKTKLMVSAGLVGGAAAVAASGRRRGRSPLHELDRATENTQLAGEEHWLVSLDGAELFVTVSGPVDGPVVVLAHCWTGSRQVWAPVTKRLVAAGCRVVRWDQRGHGRSVAGRKGHSVDGLADDMATVMTELDLSDAVVAGHSLGGMTVQAFATHHHDVFHERVRAAVLVATAGHGLRNGLTRQLANLVRASFVERLFENPVAARLMVRSTFGRFAHRHHLETTAADFVATPAHVRHEFLTSVSGMDLREGIARIDVPTTILVGSLDTLTPPALSRSMAATIPGATLELLPGYGHMLPYEAPDIVADAVLAHVA